MKVSTFFKILNKKIEQYDKMATNPFTNPCPIILIWVEDIKTNNNNPKKNNRKI